MKLVNVNIHLNVDQKDFGKILTKLSLYTFLKEIFKEKNELCVTFV